MRVLRKFVINGAVLTASSLLLRTLGVAFNAFITRKLGEGGVGLFTLIMSVYGLAVTVAASGVNLAATRMCAEAIGRGEEGDIPGVLGRAAAYSAGCGIFAASALFFFSEYISEVWLGDLRCALSLKLLAVSLPFISLSNVLHGYFTAVRKAPKSAATQIFEQLFKIGITTFGLLCLFPDITAVTDEYRHLEYACAIIVGGGAVAEIASFLFAFLLFIIERRITRRKNAPVSHGKRLTKELFGITVPVAMAAYARSGLSTLEHILIPRGLRANPLTAETALASYGVLCGMAMPIIMFPTALLYSFTGLLIPEFSEAKAKGESVRIQYMGARTVKLTLIFSVGCAILMSVFSEEIGRIVYDSHDAGRFIGMMAPLIPLMYLDHAVDAMLKGLGEQLYCMKVNIADSALCTVMVYFLCSKMGIYGYIITIYVAESFNIAMSMWKLVRVSGLSTNIINGFVKPVGAALIAGWMVGCFEDAFSVITGGIVLMGAYIVLLTVSGAVDKKDIRWIAGAFGK